MKLFFVIYFQLNSVCILLFAALNKKKSVQSNCKDSNSRIYKYKFNPRYQTIAYIVQLQKKGKLHLNRKKTLSRTGTWVSVTGSSAMTDWTFEKTE